MLRVACPALLKRFTVNGVRFYAASTEGDDKHSDVRDVAQVVLRVKDSKLKDLDEVLDGIKPKGQVNAVTNQVTYYMRLID